jgi:hypothetical protein
MNSKACRQQSGSSRRQMPPSRYGDDRRSNHSRDGGHGIVHDRAVSVALGEEAVGVKAERLGEAAGDSVGNVFGRR